MCSTILHWLLLTVRTKTALRKKSCSFPFHTGVQAPPHPFFKYTVQKTKGIALGMHSQPKQQMKVDHGSQDCDGNTARSAASVRRKQHVAESCKESCK